MLAAGEEEEREIGITAGPMGGTGAGGMVHQDSNGTDQLWYLFLLSGIATVKPFDRSTQNVHDIMIAYSCPDKQDMQQLQRGSPNNVSNTSKFREMMHLAA